MATSSFSKDFIVEDVDAIEALIKAMEKPTPVLLENEPELDEQERNAILCKFINSLN